MAVEEVPRSRRADVAGAVWIFNAVVVGIAGLYAGTDSLWLTGAAGAAATGLAGVYLISARHNPESAEIADPTLATMTSLETDLAIESTLAGEGGGVRPMEDADDARKEFEEFFRAEYPRLVYAITRQGANLAEAEDIAAEVMTRTYVRWADITNPTAYTYRSAVNAYYVRARQRGRETPLDDEHVAEPSVLDELYIGEEERRVLEVINRLSPAQRRVMALLYAGLSTTEIAHQTGTSEATVRSNLRHARQRLRDLLADEDLL